jgi:hypothetical protein
MSLFSLTSFYELTNETIINSTSLLLGIPTPHALFLKSQGQQYANIDVWSDFLLNNPAHAGDTRKLTHNKMARELTKIANECGISTTCNESKLPYRDAGRPNQTRKRADMMTLQGGCVQPNHRLNFTRSTRLIMDVTIGHVYNVHHVYKPGNLRQMEASKRNKYLEHYQQQRYAFAPMAANSLGQCGPDCLQFLWLAADHAAQIQYGFSLDDININYLNENSITSKQNIDYRRVLGKKYHENRLRLLTCIFEAITERSIGVTNVLSNSKVYQQWLAETRHNWLPTCPTYDLSSQTTDSFLGSSVDTLSDSSPMYSENNIISEFENSQQTDCLPSRISQSPSTSVALPSNLDSPSALIINNRVGGYRRDREQDLDNSTSSDLIHRPSQRRRITMDSHLQITTDIQYTSVL